MPKFKKFFDQKRIYTSLLSLSCLFILSTANCQDNLNAIKTTFNQYHQNIINEKIFVHTDKSFYVAGEIAWFKLYVVNAATLTPLDLSKVGYVEILDSANNHLLQAKISLGNAEGNGSFYLPLSINSGNYKLRAYTNWMKNFSPEYFFEKNITIINVQKRLSLSAAENATRPDVQFFPEGGNMITNIPIKVAFKGTDQFGKSIGFKGFLIDNNDTLLSFKPQHAGMGYFSFTPLTNHTYKAFIQTDSGERIVKDLPAAYSDGYVMALSDSANKIVVEVRSGASFGSEIYLFAHTRETIKVVATATLQNGRALFIFDKEKLGDGISHITIFNSQRQPICERLYFKKPATQLDLKINTNQPVYATRKKIDINIGVGDTKLKNDTASLSMTVYRLDSPEYSKAANINSYLLFTSDLVGSVEDPNFYFGNDDTETRTALDNVMLTNGWRRFKWEDVLNNKKTYFQFIPEFDGPMVVGNLINTKTGGPSPNIESFIGVPGFQTEFNSSLSDKDGKVKFELKHLYGPSEIILQTNTAKDSIYRIDVADPYSNAFSSTPLPEFNKVPATENSLRAQSVSMQVQNIYSGKKLRQLSSPGFDTTSFYLHPDAKYLLDDYTRFTTIEEVLREYVILTDVRKREGDFHFELYDYANITKLKTDPLVLLDGVPVFDFNKFMKVDPLKLYKVEVLNRKYFLGSSIFTGVLNWSSYKGDMADYDPGPHATIIDYDGLQAEREFYAPSYVTEDQKLSHVPDFRNVLQWSPNIKIASGASTQINFYTSDVPGKYVVEVQGVDKNGLSGSKTFTFEVER
ncbi:MAG: hypothetical protein ABJA90_11065 [Ginsengibacter sp.]